MFKETHPILGTRDIQRAIAFYTQRLGFKLAFGDKADPPNYVGFRRDAVELHMQFQFEHEMGTIRLRFLVDDPDALFSEYRQRGVECNPNSVHDTSWGTREFALYDLDRNALTFYRDPTSAEKGADAEQASHRKSPHGEHEERRGKTSRVSEYDRWAKKHPNDASMMGGFHHGWLRDRLEDLGSRIRTSQMALCHPERLSVPSRKAEDDAAA
jgi:catechol 2,3-dioxygenase-like lactoylglutathione lyase family enzyme